MEPSKHTSVGSSIDLASDFWDRLHENPRFRPQYPSEHVVRFLRTLPDRLAPDRGAVRAIDIGCGGGRHTFLLAELGFTVDAVDISAEGLRHTRAALAAGRHDANLMRAPMNALPYDDDAFGVAVSFGVFYYGTLSEGRGAIAELRRILVPGGKAFVVVRSTDDFRFGKGTPIEHQSFSIQIDATNERGTVQHFLSAEDVEECYRDFRDVRFERAEVSFDARKSKNSDWLITVEK